MDDNNTPRGTPFYHHDEKNALFVERKINLEWTENSFDINTPSEVNPTFIGLAFGKSRLNITIGIVIFIFSFLLAKTAHLQIVKGEYYHNLSEGNRIRVQNIMPQRGIIFDRQNRQLVRNIANFNVGVIPIDLPKQEDESDALIENIARSLGLSSLEIDNNLQLFGKNYPHLIILKKHIGYEDALRLMIENANYSGVIFDIGYEREYLAPSPGLETSPVQVTPHSLSHVLGYTGTITATELEDSKRTEKYLFNDTIGKAGIESSYETVMRGELGERQIEVDVFGKEKQTISQRVDVPGKDVFLTIDYEVQKKLENILQKHLDSNKKTRGAAIALSPKDGEILALVSLPSFNNNDFAKGISESVYASVISDPNQPLFNRAISGMYPSGSTIKPVVAASALEEGVVNEHTTITSVGGIRINANYFPDWKTTGHGPTDVYSAIAWSVNTYFYYISGGYANFDGLGLDKLTDYFRKFGLGRALGVDLPSEATGLVPSQEWKKKVKNERWYIGDTYHLGIGQGDLLVTPLQVATWTAFFANGGTLYKPHILYATRVPESGTLEMYQPEILASNIIEPTHVLTIKRALGETVSRGSATRFQAIGVKAGAKTGTAQWHSEKDPHAWFTAFAPYDEPKIVITVLIEEGKGGSGPALDVAREFLYWYFWEKK